MERKEYRDEARLVLQRPLNVTQVQKFTQRLAGTDRPLSPTPTLFLSLLYSHRPSLFVLCILTNSFSPALSSLSGVFPPLCFFFFCSHWPPQRWCRMSGDTSAWMRLSMNIRCSNSWWNCSTYIQMSLKSLVSPETYWDTAFNHGFTWTSYCSCWRIFHIMSRSGQKDNIGVVDKTKDNIIILKGITVIHSMYCRFAYKLSARQKCQQKHIYNLCRLMSKNIELFIFKKKIFFLFVRNEIKHNTEKQTSNQLLPLSLK